MYTQAADLTRQLQGDHRQRRRGRRATPAEDPLPRRRPGGGFPHWASVRKRGQQQSAAEPSGEHAREQVAQRRQGREGQEPAGDDGVSEVCNETVKHETSTSNTHSWEFAIPLRSQNLFLRIPFTATCHHALGTIGSLYLVVIVLHRNGSPLMLN